MLLSFRVANHRSFREQQELLLLPVYAKGVPAVPVAAIYGANASGKSNLLDALRTMRRAVVSSFARWEPLGGTPREPFALARAAKQEDSRFGVDLLIDGEKYVYGFALNGERITEEWLYHYPHSRRRILFERTADDFRFGDSLRGPKNVIEEVTRANSLFLSASAHHGMEQLLPVYSWFDRALSFADPYDRDVRRSRTVEKLDDPDAVRRILHLLRAADLGIKDIRLSREKDIRRVRMVVPLLNLEPADRKWMHHQLQLASESDFATEKWGIGWRDLLQPSPKVTTLRDTPDGTASLTLEQESTGTQTWFDLLGLVLDVLDHGSLVAVDELDTSLHPLLLRELVRMFQSAETNPRGAQLVFTTHDTSLLARQGGEEGLRRDEVWFTEKDDAGETRLYPLTDFRPRAGLNWERRYLGGSVGAVPFLDDRDFVTTIEEHESAPRG